MRDGHQYQRPDKEDALPQQLWYAEANDTLNETGVGGQPRGQLTDPPYVEESGRLPNERSEQPLAKARDYLLRDGSGDVALTEVDEGLEREERNQRDRDAVEQVAVTYEERGVEQLAHDEGKGEADPRAQQHENGGKAERLQMRSHERRQTPQEADGFGRTQTFFRGHDSAEKGYTTAGS